MSMCGYHLRCLNYGHGCSECRHANQDKTEDRLYDALDLRLKGEEASRAVRAPIAQGLGDLIGDAFGRQEREGEINKLY